MGLTRSGVWCTSLTDVGFLCLCLTVALAPSPMLLCLHNPPCVCSAIMSSDGFDAHGPHSSSTKWKDLPSTTRLWQWVPLGGSHGQWNRAQPSSLRPHACANTLWLHLPLDQMFSAAAWQSRWVRRLVSDGSDASDATIADQASPSRSGSPEGAMSDINEGIPAASLAVMEVQGREPSPLSPVQSVSPKWGSTCALGSRNRLVGFSQCRHPTVPRSRASAPVEPFLQRLLEGMCEKFSVTSLLSADGSVPSTLPTLPVWETRRQTMPAPAGAPKIARRWSYASSVASSRWYPTARRSHLSRSAMLLFFSFE